MKKTKYLLKRISLGTNVITKQKIKLMTIQKIILLKYPKNVLLYLFRIQLFKKDLRLN